MIGEGLQEQVARFARLLRAAGVPIGPARVIEAVRALGAVDITRRDDFYWALHAVFVHRADQRAVFRAAFRRFWRDPALASPPLDPAEHGARTGHPSSELEAGVGRMPEAEDGGNRRGAGASARAGGLRSPPVPDGSRRGEGEDDGETPGGERSVGIAYSPGEALRTRDFAAMTTEELAAARDAVAGMDLSLPPARTRRFRPDPGGARLDLAATLRAGLRSGGRDLPLRWRSRSRRERSVVALCDVSGSMEGYARILLHFLHALARDRGRVSAFLFGTRITNVTRHLRRRDPDEALRAVAGAVPDWSGGTRIGSCLEEFDRRWSRRVLAGRAVVLLITDGLDRDAGEGLARAMERVHRSCDRLVWLNPLLRYEGFAPVQAGARAMLPHVDELRPVHDLASLEALAEALRRSPSRPSRPTGAPRRSSPSTPFRRGGGRRPARRS